MLPTGCLFKSVTEIDDKEIDDSKVELKKKGLRRQVVQGFNMTERIIIVYWFANILSNVFQQINLQN